MNANLQGTLVVYCLLFFFMPIFNALDSINPGQSIKEYETLVSPAGTFEAGFFRKSNGTYLGIWFKNISPTTIVWVANRGNPIGNSSGILEVTNGGNLVILDGSRATIWSSNTSTTAQNPVVQLLDSGNLVVKEANNPDKFLWQSFDYPGDTFLPGMIIRSSMISGMHTSLTSWRNNDDPALGDWSYYIDTHGLPQMVITKGQTLTFRPGPWNGFHFSGVPSKVLHRFFNFSFVMTDQEIYYTYELLNSSTITRFILNPYGLGQRFIWSDTDKMWQLVAVGPLDQCDNYAVCGANSVCNISNYPTCVCLRGFVQKSGGCIRGVKLDCNDRDGFVKYAGMKLPNTSFSWFDKNMDLNTCEKLCLQNCSCTAYANLDTRNGGSGCVLWFGDIVDARVMTSEGQDLYIRVPESELDSSDNTKNKGKLNKKQLEEILLGCAVFIIGLKILGVVFYLRRKKLKKQGRNQVVNSKPWVENNEKEDIDIPSFDLSTIAYATSQFSITNKLGEGGFGPVYKGILANGHEIAVKRLSNNSGQGPQEFKNEVELIANLQHRNLVKLLGCCIHDDERLLIYEYMPNRSLDYFIFDQTRRNCLSWTQCYQIICGIARGLLYLHEDSRLRIIHRDLKTSNILLDKKMNPKISDFGLARIFGGDENEAKTKRIVGTYGYMPPEYAIHGWFSVKSDVFSFGVIILEILSGRRNRVFGDPSHNLDLLGHAWRLWCEKRPLELIDESIGDSLTQVEVVRSIHIGLLCVQERPEDRPDMSSLVLMLNGEKPLPVPREPAFYPHQSASGSASGNGECDSTNEMSISMLSAR